MAVLQVSDARLTCTEGKYKLGSRDLPQRKDQVPGFYPQHKKIYSVLVILTVTVTKYLTGTFYRREINS